jgi:hypothetical protein
MRLLYLLLFVALNVQAGEQYATSDKPLTASEAYARAAHQDALKSTDVDSLRVWIRSYMTGSVRGYVLSKSGSLSCQTSSTYADGVVSVSPAQCRPFSKGAQILKRLEPLPAFSQEDWDCPLDDGGEVFIEGVRKGEHFAIRVGNPSFCSDTDSKAIVALLRKLR